MALTDELTKLKTLDFPETVKLIESFMEKPEVKLYVALGKVVDKVVREIDKITSKENTFILEGDDKLFERVNTLVVKYSEYKEAFERGRLGIVVKEEDAPKAGTPLFGQKKNERSSRNNSTEKV